MKLLALFIRTTVLAGLLSAALMASAQLVRVANTSLMNLPAQPPQFGYTLNNAFPTVALSQPVCLAAPPQETNRLFILEKTGSIVVITNLAAPTRTVFMSLAPIIAADSESGLLGLAFHPDYATNRYFFVFYTRTNFTTSQGMGRHQCISRFQTTLTNASIALTNSELMLIAQRDTAGNHNGGDLHFGPDGYLYASVGDEGPQHNGARHAQIITNKFFSAILRLDVDKRPGNLPPNPHPANSTNYFVPVDNPYIGFTNFNGQSFSATNVRTEFYSIGYRNPWRMSFDPVTGFLYVADVGQNFYEEVSVITNGANAGWAYYEGKQLAKPLYPSQTTILTNPPLGLTLPIQDYAHGSGTNQGNSISGGIVSRGNRISQLYGAYVFGDYASGNIWMLSYDGSNTVPFQRITGASGPVAFGRDPRNGDVLVAQLNNSQIGRLDYDAVAVGAPLPPTLADTGVFTNLTTLAPAPGIVPYEVNVPFWSDNAIKSRWFSVPNTNSRITFNPGGNWSFPTGMVWIKHFELELTNGVPASRKRLETRLLVRNATGGYGITYRWGNATTNAALVAESGLDESFVINDGGNVRTQVWHYPARSECLACHTAVGGFAQAFSTEQLNRDFTYGVQTTNQISALSAAGYFTALVTNHPATLLALAAATNTAATLEFRARSYLAANCAGCHQPGGPVARATWDARIQTSTANAGLIRGEPANDLGSTNNFIIVPQAPTNSILLMRLAVRDLGTLPSIQMPPLASMLPDTAGVNLVSNWIASLPLTGRPNVPAFSSLQRFGNNIVFHGTNGWPAQNYYVLTSTNLATPVTNWARAATNPFTAGGGFNFTNPINGPGTNQLFFMLQLQ